MMLKRIWWGILFLVVLLVYPVGAGAAYGINRTINFQGKLVDSSGVNVPNSTPVTATFSIYQTNSTCPGGGTPVWSENQTFTPVDGIFQVQLGSQTVFGSNIDFSQDTLYLGILISGETNEMCIGSSRIRLAAVPQAFNAERFAGLTADNSQTNYFTISGGQGTLSTLKISGDITIGPIISPTSAGALEVLSNEANSLTLDTGGDAAVNLGTTNATSVVIGRPGQTTQIKSGTPSANGILYSSDANGTLAFTATGGAGTLCLLSVSGGTPVFGTCPGSVSAWSSITDPVSSMSRNMGNWYTSFNWGTGTGSNNLFDLKDTTGNTGTGYLLSVGNVGTSTAKPFTVSAQGNTLIDTTATGGLTLNSGGTSTLSLDTGGAGSVNIGTTNSNLITIGRSGTVNSSGSIVKLPGGLMSQGWVTGKALAIFDETGDQNIIVASASGVTKFTVDRNGAVTAGAANFTALSGAGLANCTGDNNRLTWSSSSSTFGCSSMSASSFVSTTAVGLVSANNTTNYYVKAAENGNVQANITLTATSNQVFGIVSMEVTSNTSQDQEVVSRVERNTGADVTCNSGTSVGGTPGMFSTNTGVVKTSTVTFVDNPATLSNLRYTLCSDTRSSGNMSGNVTRVRITLFEITNAADLAEVYPTGDESLMPGEVVTIDPLIVNGVKRTEGAYNRNLLGVISTEPAMVIGGTGGQAHGVAVALSGRVPVRVTAEYGEIKQGDMLTSSPIPGVAMKAIKAGPILGVALGDYSGNETGTVTMFVKSGWYNGSNLAEIFNNSEVEDPSRVVLDRVINDIPEVDPKAENLSAIFTDRLVAGLEVITPKLTADKVFTRVISPVGGENLTFELSGGQVVLRNRDTSVSAIILDASGSARFAGGITADWIKANRIEGMEVLAARYSGLEQKVASLSGMIVNSPTPTVLPSPTITPVASLDLTVLGELIIDKGLTVNGPAVFSDQVTFEKQVTLNSTLLLNNNTAGTAIIKAGTDRVDIVFDKPYADPPVVSITLSINSQNKADGSPDEKGDQQLEKEILGGNYSYLIGRKTNEGFSIIMNKRADRDITFSWTVWAVKNMRIITSGPPVLFSTPTPIPVTNPETSPLPTIIPEEGTSISAVMPYDEESSHSATITL